MYITLQFPGAGAMLTQTQASVYQMYLGKGLLKSGTALKTDAGSWEHMSCKYKEGMVLFFVMVYYSFIHFYFYSIVAIVFGCRLSCFADPSGNYTFYYLPQVRLSRESVA